MIRQLSPLPYIDEHENLHNGLIRRPPVFCDQCMIRTCAKIGYQEKEIGVLKTCSKGANYVYMSDSVGNDLIWNGFLVKGVKYPPNHKQILRKGIELDKESFEELVGLFSPTGALAASALDFRKRGQSQALHDLKHLINALTRIVERNEVRIAQESNHPTPQEVSLLQSVVNEVYQILGAIKNQIELSDFIITPEAADMGQDQEIDIYGLFFKNVQIYNVLANSQGKNIEISSVGGIVQAKRVLPASFTLLPAILLDNAMKYSVSGNSIAVRISEQGKKIHLVVESRGATVPEEKQGEIWGEGTRFAHPELTERPGSGFGLYLAKKVCEMAGFEIAYHCEVDKYQGGVPYGLNQFILTEQ